MKKKLVLALLTITVNAAWMTGCGSTSGATTEASTAEVSIETTESAQTDASTQDDAAAQEESEEIANPWTESDEQGVMDATGFSMVPPDGAENVVYSYMAEDKLAQMTYELDGAKWVYRMQMADALTDISGLYMDWTGDEGTVAGLEAMYYGQGDLNDETVDDVQLVNWYDAVSGVTYSLSATGPSLDGMDIQVYAENLYVPLQGDATDDPVGDRERELNDYFLGEHESSYDGSTLTITDNGDDTFRVDLDLFRLCTLENGTGTFADHKMNFTVVHPGGDTISGVIYRDSDNSLVVKITDSTFDYLPNGSVIDRLVKR